MDLKQFQILKEELETLKKKASKAEGSLESNLNRLKEDYNSTYEEGLCLLKSMKKDKFNLEKEIDLLLKEIEEQYGDKLQ